MSTETNRSRREAWAEAVKPIVESIEARGDEALFEALIRQSRMLN